jgi:hypothetical protein
MSWQYQDPKVTINSDTEGNISCIGSLNERYKNIAPDITKKTQHKLILLE